MALRSLPDVLGSAVAAAARVRDLAVDHRARSGVHVAELARLANRLQAEFEAIKPLLKFGPGEVQGASAALYGSQSPEDVLAVVAAGQAAGAAVVAAIVLHANSPAARAGWAWHDPAGIFVEVGLTGDDIAWLHAPLDALIAALAPVAG